MHFSLLLAIISILSFGQVMARLINFVVPANRVDGVCADVYTPYIKYNATVTSGSVHGIYLSPQSNFTASRDWSQTRTSNQSTFNFLYQRSASCPKNNVTRIAQCNIAKVPAVPIAEPYCIMVDNIDGTSNASVSVDYEFSSTAGDDTSSSTPDISPRSSSIFPSSAGLGAFSLIIEHMTVATLATISIAIAATLLL